MALMKRAAGEDMCPLTTARLHKQDNKALNMHSSPFPAQEESQSEEPPPTGAGANTIAWAGLQMASLCRHSRTAHREQGSRRAVGKGSGSGGGATAEQSCVKSPALMSGQIKCYTQRRRDPLRQRRLPACFCSFSLLHYRLEMLTPATPPPSDICLKLRFMSCHESN